MSFENVYIDLIQSSGRGVQLDFLDFFPQLDKYLYTVRPSKLDNTYLISVSQTITRLILGVDLA